MEKNFKDFYFVKPIKTDVKKFDFTTIKPIKFAFIGCRFILTYYKCPENLKVNMCSGGKLIVDDVSKDNSWDGADQAFHEFVKKYSLKFKLIEKNVELLNFNNAQ